MSGDKTFLPLYGFMSGTGTPLFLPACDFMLLLVDSVSSFNQQNVHG
jgi:hypothetical protein